MSIRIFYDRRSIRELKAAGLQHFEEGDVDSINPNLPLGEQADLLPYDSKYEFPKEQLTFEDELGSGAYGVVYKAIAKNIRPNEDESTVAVKMIKRNYDNEVIDLFPIFHLCLIPNKSQYNLCNTRLKVMRALVMELKIMIHLRHHENVVNLLGAVTENIANRKQQTNLTI